MTSNSVECIVLRIADMNFRIMDMNSDAPDTIYMYLEVGVGEGGL